MLGYSVIEPKVCQKVGVGRRKNLKQYIRGYHAYMIIWKPLFGECLQCVKEPEVDKNAGSLVHTNYHCKEEEVVHVLQKFPLLYPYFYPWPIALWTSLQLENTSTVEINTDWKSLHFDGPEKAIKLAKR